MTRTTLTAAPQPLPGASKPGQPAPLPATENPIGWLDRDIATINYTGDGYSSTCVPSASFDRMTDGEITTKGPVFHPAGASFQDAVKTAQALSRESYKQPSRMSYIGFISPDAYAVLQAQDGAWYTTALREKSSRKFYAYIDEREEFGDRIYVTPLTPGLKAVVSMNQWVNFSDEEYVPERPPLPPELV